MSRKKILGNWVEAKHLKDTPLEGNCWVICYAKLRGKQDGQQMGALEAARARLTSF